MCLNLHTTYIKPTYNLHTTYIKHTCNLHDFWRNDAERWGFVLLQTAVLVVWDDGFVGSKG